MDETCTRTQENNPRPQMDELCSDCKDKFSEHYTTYGNETTGCAHRNAGVYGTSGCQCDGFKIMFKWEHDLTIVDTWQAEK